MNFLNAYQIKFSTATCMQLKLFLCIPHSLKMQLITAACSIVQGIICKLIYFVSYYYNLNLSYSFVYFDDTPIVQLASSTINYLLVILCGKIELLKRKVCIYKGCGQGLNLSCTHCASQWR